MNTTSYKNILKSEQGFTLVEVIAVLIILGILAAVAVPKYIGLEENAKNRAIDAGISEINGRESLNWAKSKIDPDSTKIYTTDALFFANVMNVGTITSKTNMYNLNTDTTTDNYKWEAAPSLTGGTLSFQGGPVTGTLTGVELCRDPSTLERPANWKRKPSTGC